MSSFAAQWSSIVRSDTLGEYSQDGLTKTLTSISVSDAESTPKGKTTKRHFAAIFGDAKNKSLNPQTPSTKEAVALEFTTPQRSAATTGVDDHTDKKSRLGNGDAAPSSTKEDFNAAANKVFEVAAAQNTPVRPSGTETTTENPPAATQEKSLPSTQQLGNALFPKVVATLAGSGGECLAGKVTGMLLEAFESGELLEAVENLGKLWTQVDKAINVLKEKSIPEALSVNLSPAPIARPSTPVPFEPLTARRVQQRDRQVQMGLATQGYQNFCKVVKLSCPLRGDPQQPDPRKPCSKRSFDGVCLKWRRALHRFDDWSECEKIIEERKKKMQEDRATRKKAVARRRSKRQPRGNSKARRKPSLKRSQTIGGQAPAATPVLERSVSTPVRPSF